MGEPRPIRLPWSCAVFRAKLDQACCAEAQALDGATMQELPVPIARCMRENEGCYCYVARDDGEILLRSSDIVRRKR